jgi:putative DNA primase/helicase
MNVGKKQARSQAQPPREAVRTKLTDMGNAERFARQWQGKLIYVPGIGWHIYEGGRWQHTGRGEEVEKGKLTVRAMYREAANSPDEEYRAALSKHARECEAERKLLAMIRLAQSIQGMAVLPGELDSDPYLLNAVNGTVDLRTGALRSHDPADYLTKQCAVAYDPAAECPLFSRFIDQIFGGDEELVSYVQRLLGNAVSGDACTQYLPIFWGEGANGKSTLLDAAKYAMGDYAGLAADSLLTVGKNEHPTEIADLQGLRLVIASETEVGARLRVQLVKKLTGESRLKARRMRQDFYDFARTHHIFLQTNNKPSISENSEAVWRRIRLVPFQVIIPEEERDEKLGQKLKAEAAGILTWLVMGCLAWQRDGLAMPAAVQGANQTYREESDRLAEFFEECCVFGNLCEVLAGSLRATYMTFCTDRGMKPQHENAMADRLKKMGCIAVKRNRGRTWNGIGLAAKYRTGDVENEAA